MGKAILYGIIVLFIVVIAGLAYAYMSDDIDIPVIEPTTYTWDFNIADDNGWNTVTFTQEHLDCCGSTNVEDVFSSLGNTVTWVFEDGSNKNWNGPDSSGNTLHVIQPNVLYNVKVTQDCTLTFTC